jgi:hypothetical protein
MIEAPFDSGDLSWPVALNVNGSPLAHAPCTLVLHVLKLGGTCTTQGNHLSATCTGHGRCKHSDVRHTSQ